LPDIRKHAHFLICIIHARRIRRSCRAVSRNTLCTCVCTVYPIHKCLTLIFVLRFRCLCFRRHSSTTSTPTHRHIHTCVYCQQITHDRLRSRSRSLASFRQLLVIYNTRFRRVLARSIYPPFRRILKNFYSGSNIVYKCLH